MKKLLMVVALVAASSVAVLAKSSQYPSWDTGTGSSPNSERVSGYTRQDGTYVEPYNRTKADDTLNNNYSTRGNENPWTGEKGNGQTDYDRQYKTSGQDTNSDQ